MSRTYVDMNVWERPNLAGQLVSGVAVPALGDPNIYYGEMNVPKLIANPSMVGIIDPFGLGGDELKKKPLVSETLPGLVFDGVPLTSYYICKLPKWFYLFGAVVKISALDSGLTDLKLSYGYGSPQALTLTVGERYYSSNSLKTGSASYVALFSTDTLVLTETIVEVNLLGVRLWDALTLD